MLPCIVLLLLCCFILLMDSIVASGCWCWMAKSALCIIIMFVVLFIRTLCCLAYFVFSLRDLISFKLFISIYLCCGYLHTIIDFNYYCLSPFYSYSYIVKEVYQASAIPLLLKVQDDVQQNYNCTVLDKRIAIMGYSEGEHCSFSTSYFSFSLRWLFVLL